MANQTKTAQTPDGENTQAAAPATPPAPPAPPARPAAAPAPRKLQLVEEAGKRTDQEAVNLLLAACEKFGVNPESTCRPPELKAWRFYPADDLDHVPASVVIVTHGGMKIRHYGDPDYMAVGCLEPAMDQDTEDRLRRLFGFWNVDPKTKDVTPAPFGPDLTLPATSVDGRVRSGDHQYRGGYLKAGGKEAAAKRGR